jgi:hypothetical protein
MQTKAKRELSEYTDLRAIFAAHLAMILLVLATRAAKAVGVTGVWLILTARTRMLAYTTTWTKVTGGANQRCA